MSNDTTPSADSADAEAPASDPQLNTPEAAPSETEAADAPDGDDQAEASFDDMALQDSVLQGLQNLGYERPMEVQSVVYDKIVAGGDLMVQARTGTGKTAAFGIPIAQRLDPNQLGAQVLILAPIRELALQVANEIKQITGPKGLKVVPIYGGAAMKPQIDALAAGAQIVSGTPGRVLDHIGRGNLKTDQIKLLILDECDEMLSMGFQEEIDRIVSTLPPREERQTLLFSATIPDEIQRIAKRHMRDPETISLSEGGISVAEIDHRYYVVSGMARTRDLLKVLLFEKPGSALIFCNTRDDTSNVAKFLQRHGFDALAISSDLSQNERERTMASMRSGKTKFLVATDVAARGIDISDLSHVINYQFPESPEVYVHRTGRTARAGKEGVAISLVGPREIGSFYYLKLTYKILPVECDLPSNEELSAREEGERYQKVVDLVREPATEDYIALARRLWQSSEGERVVAVLLKNLLESQTVVVQERRQARPPEGEERGDRDERPRRSRRRERDDSGPRRGREETGRGRGRERDDGRRRRGRDEGGGGRERSSGDRERTSGSRERTSGTRERSSGTRERSSGARERSSGDRGARRTSSEQPRPSEGMSADPSKEFWEAWADEKAADSERPPRPANDEDHEPEGPQTTRLYVNLGKREQITADEVRELLAEGLETGEQIGSVALRNTHCYVRVPEAMADAIIDATRGKVYKEREVVVERARR